MLDINKFLNHKVTKITKQHATWRAVFYRSPTSVSFGRRFFCVYFNTPEEVIFIEANKQSNNHSVKIIKIHIYISCRL